MQDACAFGKIILCRSTTGRGGCKSLSVNWLSSIRLGPFGARRSGGERGDTAAQYNLGTCYVKGRGVVQDYVEAVKWFRKAAEQAEAAAQTSLGVAYADGDGVIKDYVQAYQWFNLASAQGDESAKQFLSALEQRMTPEQVGEGQRLAREFKPRKPTE